MLLLQLLACREDHYVLSVLIQTVQNLLLKSLMAPVYFLIWIVSTPLSLICQELFKKFKILIQTSKHIWNLEMIYFLKFYHVRRFKASSIKILQIPPVELRNAILLLNQNLMDLAVAYFRLLSLQLLREGLLWKRI